MVHVSANPFASAAWLLVLHSVLADSHCTLLRADQMEPTLTMTCSPESSVQAAEAVKPAASCGWNTAVMLADCPALSWP